MTKTSLRLAAAAGALAVAGLAQATPLPNLVNLNFLNYSGAAPKNYFVSVDPVGWTGGNGLIFIDQPGNSSNPNSACGSVYLTTYGCPSTLAISGGYNYVEADGNPTYESGFNYTISGLTKGETYTLSFYEAASQQTGFGNGLNTTEQWIVSLGTQGMQICYDCGSADSYYGGYDSTYYNNDPTASIEATTLMTTPSGGMTDWQYVSVNLTADASTDVLSFLAWGDNGNTVNLPPIVFLAGVDSPSGLNTGVPEPTTLVLAALSVLGIGVAGLLQRRARPAQA
jgi:hypothetical protein